MTTPISLIKARNGKGYTLTYFCSGAPYATYKIVVKIMAKMPNFELIHFENCVVSQKTLRLLETVPNCPFLYFEKCVLI